MKIMIYLTARDFQMESNGGSGKNKTTTTKKVSLKVTISPI